MSVTFLLEDSLNLVDWSKSLKASSTSPFEAAQAVARKLGVHVNANKLSFGFWAPELKQQNIAETKVWLELLTPKEPIAVTATEQTLEFEVKRLAVKLDDVFVWSVIEGALVGTRNTFGMFYQLVFEDAAGNTQIVRDYLAYSLPFGVLAPAEIVDISGVLSERKDAEHFKNLKKTADPDGILRVNSPCNILQIHVATVTKEGTLASLTRLYQNMAEKLRHGEVLTPFEQSFMAYDAVQLMPIEPTIEHEADPSFWKVLNQTKTNATVKLLKPDITNWGYDTLISGSSATNPSILETRRPHELLDFIETLHTFPEPIKVIFDVVYGHTDNQAASVISKDFLAGAGMYGQNMNFQHPITRAVMLELQRRKSQYGVDGIRVDGAQDFKYWDAQAQELKYDDDYLSLMNDIVLEVAGTPYRPYMIFEDGRPWPEADWELASSYREVSKQLPNVHQWGPLTFAHNTPFLFTFWLQKWWRIREMADLGSLWITGCANHDTLRRGTQVKTDARINTYLGDSLPEILRKAYDNPAAKLFDYAFMPGVPMDFIHANLRAPWSFIRNTDDRYGVKVVSEEANFLDWTVDETSFDKPNNFKRLKARGFDDLTKLKHFVRVLDHAVQQSNYTLAEIVNILKSIKAFPESVLEIEALKATALAWMDDLHDFVNLANHTDKVIPEQVTFNLMLRRFRQERPWLQNNLSHQDSLDYIHPSDGSVIFYGLRTSPDKKEQLFFMANMEGASKTLSLQDLPLNLKYKDWHPIIQTPTLELIDEFSLKDSQGFVLKRNL